MEPMAAAIGVSVPVLRFLLCFFATVPVSFIWRLVPGSPCGKHLYAAVSGAVLSYLSFGFSANLLFLFPILLGYASMVLYRSRCGIITFFLGFAYLIGCHVYFMSGDAWKEGGIDATVRQCVVEFMGRQWSEGHDGTTMELVVTVENVMGYGRKSWWRWHWWDDGGGVWRFDDEVPLATIILNGQRKRGFGRNLRNDGHHHLMGKLSGLFTQVACCMGLYLYLVPKFPLSRFTDPVYHEWGFWKRLGYQYMAGFTARWKYYFIWSISEAAIIISGLGFSGWTDSSPPKPLWDRAKNVSILGVELAKTAAQIPLAWNIQVSTWLRHYVYDRLIQKGKKPGFFQLLATQTVSAVWHGLYPGYIIFFVQSALMIAGSRAIYRWQQSVPPNMALLKKLLAFLNFAYTILVLNYSSVGFMVLSLHETLIAYGSVYFIGTILPIVVILLSYVIKPARPSRSKARKEQ
ncbi:MBOAT (membrane bound O-acyl transferase) family protein [Actinidia rufa]|uniref:MBOAT (Membrane bound O-acyl transferase) family protein n=1 Tax=Actinidia rufa TaxID=165716 RepID=A0A7J0FRC8_9ERIC|nr:MBOAT (membrane bound O-acyl transferase) family protein [Actinidia rufa]